MRRKTEFYLIPGKPEHRAIRLDIIEATTDHKAYIALKLPGKGYAGILHTADLEPAGSRGEPVESRRLRRTKKQENWSYK